MKNAGFDRFLQYLESLVMLILTTIVIAILVFTTVDLIALVVKDIYTPPLFLISVTKLQEMLGFVLLILIGVELLESIKTYLTEKLIHGEVVLMIAIIAVARKVIILNFRETESNVIIAIGLVIITLCIGYYLIRRTRMEEKKMQEK
jgi:uncharacterized membrane protein (DUF373 family)